MEQFDRRGHIGQDGFKRCAEFVQLRRCWQMAKAANLHGNGMGVTAAYDFTNIPCQLLHPQRPQHHIWRSFRQRENTAHIAACMAEHGLDGAEPVIGVAFDGTGYGDDGRIWGGEFLVADYAGYKRPFHLNYFPMAGGDTAVREPWRLALACLHQANIAWTDDLPPVQYANRTSSHDLAAIVRHQLEQHVNAPQTSSMGRLFDAVSALIGVRQTVNYEAQAAIELEMCIDPAEMGSYQLAIGGKGIEPAPLFAEIVSDLRRAVPVGVMAARFHNGIARLVRDVCVQINAAYSIKTVALSGGVWQNMALFSRTVPLLQEADFTVLWHEKVPANDGGLALGQAVIAARKLENREI